MNQLAAESSWSGLVSVNPVTPRLASERESAADGNQNRRPDA